MITSRERTVTGRRVKGDSPTSPEGGPPPHRSACTGRCTAMTPAVAVDRPPSADRSTRPATIGGRRRARTGDGRPRRPPSPPGAVAPPALSRAPAPRRCRAADLLDGPAARRARPRPGRAERRGSRGSSRRPARLASGPPSAAGRGRGRAGGTAGRGRPDLPAAAARGGPRARAARAGHRPRVRRRPRRHRGARRARRRGCGVLRAGAGPGSIGGRTAPSTSAPSAAEPRRTTWSWSSRGRTRPVAPSVRDEADPLGGTVDVVPTAAGAATITARFPCA